jgi:hypothetical protein
MSRHAAHITLRIMAGAACLAGGLSSLAMAQSAPPNFAKNSSQAWYVYNRMFLPPASGPGPVVQDAAHPYVSNDDFRVTGKQPTQRMADLSNPILQPWARDILAKNNQIAVSGKRVPSPTASCWPKGPTYFLLAPMTQPMYFVQGPKEVVMIITSFNDVRHIHLTDKHSASVKPSWYGESIGHYEGDTLVVDTIGIDDRIPLDGFGTPHTKQLHVVERFHLIEKGDILEVTVHVEDPGAFTTPWNASARYRQYEAAVRQVPVENLAQLASGEEGPLIERACAENPSSFFSGEEVLPIPQAKVADF